MFNKNRHLLAGTIIWLGVVIWLRPSLMDPAWAVLLLLFAAILIVPLAQQLISLGPYDRWLTILVFPAAVAFTAAFLLPDGAFASLLVLPWVGVTAVFAWAGLRRLQKRGLKLSPDLAVDAGLIYLLVGGIWAMLAGLGANPLGFTDDIVMLTAVHFHYAGFALPILCGLAAAKPPGLLANVAVLGVVGGVPLTAIGITLSQLGLGIGVETASAWITAGAGLLTAVLYFHLSLDSRQLSLVRGLWGITAVALTIGMILAAAYGSRQIIQPDWLTIPWMQAVHGTANSIGFSLTGLLGWYLHQK